ncbi:hypothetical protein L2E82_32097 [Cichorium intybus]|uniref:Uncharacterized protein n=1 Tax=Cichorium intybus TaxID=13427 RepID=A0ACB9BG91_CICIN|nr:hypothetical protein L2E82_32097 [Cichorium intybus]
MKKIAGGDFIGGETIIDLCVIVKLSSMEYPNSQRYCVGHHFLFLNSFLPFSLSKNTYKHQNKHSFSL